MAAPSLSHSSLAPSVTRCKTVSTSRAALTVRASSASTSASRRRCSASASSRWLASSWAVRSTISCSMTVARPVTMRRKAPSRPVNASPPPSTAHGCKLCRAARYSSVGAKCSPQRRPASSTVVCQCIHWEASRVPHRALGPAPPALVRGCHRACAGPPGPSRPRSAARCPPAPGLAARPRPYRRSGTRR